MRTTQLFGLLLAITGAATGAAMAISPTTPSTTPPAARQEALAPAAGHPVVRDGRFEFTVAHERDWCVDDARPGLPQPDGWWCLVPLIVRNVSGEPAVFRDDRQRAQVGGRWVAPSQAADRWANEGAGVAWLEPIRPGGELVCTLWFDVPAGARIDRVMLRDSSTSDGVTIDL